MILMVITVHHSVLKLVDLTKFCVLVELIASDARWRIFAYKVILINQLNAQHHGALKTEVVRNIQDCYSALILRS